MSLKCLHNCILQFGTEYTVKYNTIKMQGWFIDPNQTWTTITSIFRLCRPSVCPRNCHVRGILLLRLLLYTCCKYRTLFSQTWVAVYKSLSTIPFSFLMGKPALFRIRWLRALGTGAAPTAPSTGQKPLVFYVLRLTKLSVQSLVSNETEQKINPILMRVIKYLMKLLNNDIRTYR